MSTQRAPYDSDEIQTADAQELLSMLHDATPAERASIRREACIRLDAFVDPDASAWWTPPSFEALRTVEAFLCEVLKKTATDEDPR